MTVRKYNRLIDIMRKGYNNQTREELLMVRCFCVKTAISKLSRCIEDTKRNNKSIRKKRQEMMINVLTVFYTYLYKSKTGQINPCMRTLALAVNPSLKKPKKTDTEKQIKEKEKAIHATEMSVQRAIKTLQEIGMITIHQYYTSDKHFESKKNACFFYELTPLSCYSNIYVDIDTTKDKYGRSVATNCSNVIVPGVSTSKTIVFPIHYDHKAKRKKEKELKRFKEALRKECIESKKVYERIMAACNNPNAKKIGTLSQILDRQKKENGKSEKNELHTS